MRTKKKYAHGGVHKWPPDTEVATASSTSVSMPQLNFLASQLLPAQVPSNIEAEMLRREGVPAISTQSSRPSLSTVRAAAAFSDQQRKKESYDIALKELTGKGVSEQTAKVMLTSDPKSPFFEDTSGRAQSIAPLIDLTPVGDVTAMAGALGQALSGDVGGAGITGGLAVASIFAPGTVPTDRRMNDMIRVMARTNEAEGYVPAGVSDIIEYIQEAATPGNISFGRTRSEALGGGSRVWREPMVYVRDIQSDDIPPRRYLREAFERPSAEAAVNQPNQPFESGEALGRGLLRSSFFGRTSDDQLQATSDMLDSFMNVHRGGLTTEQNDYYRGIISGIQGSAPARNVSRLSASRAATPSTPSARSQQRYETTEFGTGDLSIQGISRPDAIGKEVGDVGTPFRVRNFDLNISLKLDGERQASGNVRYDFFLDSRNFKQSRGFRNRVRDLENKGLSMAAAEKAAEREVASNINRALKKMYAQIPVGSDIGTSSYSTDSYPMFLQGIAGGKYRVTPEFAVGGLTGRMRRAALNDMGSKNTLFRKWSIDNLKEETASTLRENRSFKNLVEAEVRMSQVSREEAEKRALLVLTKGRMRLTGIDVGSDIYDEIKQSAVNHINKQIDRVNENAIESLIRQEVQEASARGVKMSPQQAEIKVLNEYIPLEKAQLEYGIITVPVPVSRKIRAEEGAFVPFKIKKKKTKGMRIKKGA